jgi:hypothetical protein
LAILMTGEMSTALAVLSSWYIDTNIDASDDKELKI